MAVLVLAAAEVDLETGEVRRADGAPARLTRTERALLGFLAGQPGLPLHRDALLEAVWGYRPGVRSRALDTAVKVLRKKVERDPVQPDHLCTVRGVGYRFDPIRAPAAPDPTLGTLIGRGPELAEVEAALARGARIVTLRGPGGIGKTRLAREVLRRRKGRWVDLSYATTDAEVLAAVARAVSPDEPLRDAVAVGRRLAGAGLVVLDGCEAASELVGERLVAWPGTFLATSRVALGVAGEAVVGLGPLPRPDAVALLVDRAVRRRPSFARAEPAVLDAIADAVDRVPLALELVGARAALLDAPALRERLGALDWDGSLRATVDWSWSLLPDDARTVLAACSVFAGGFEVGAAEAVAGPLVGGPVLARLEALQDASLLRVDEDRLALWVMVRSFAAEHLADRAGCEDRLADWLQKSLAGAPIARVVAEADNLRIAEAATRSGRPAVASELGLLLERALASTGPMQARLEAADRAVAAAGADAGLAARSRMARARARDTLGVGGADQDLAEARQLAILAGDPALRGQVEGVIGAVAVNRGALDEAEAAYAVAIPLLDLPELRPALADAWSNLGHVASLRGRHADAIDHLKRGLALQEEVGNAVNAAKVLGTLGVVHQRAGSVERARRFWRESLARHEAAGHRPGALRMIGNLAVSEHALGHLEDAAAGFARTASLARELGEPLIEGIVYLNAGAVALERGDDVAAEASFARSRSLLERQGARLYLARLAVWEGAVALRARDLDQAARRLADAERELVAVGDRPWVLRTRALAVATLGADHDLASLFAEADADHPLCGRWLRAADAVGRARSPAEGAPALDELRALRTAAAHEADLRMMTDLALALFG